MTNAPLDPRYYLPPGHEYLPPEPQKHSGVGIASFIIGMVVGGVQLVLVVVAAAMVMGGASEDSPQMMVVGCSFLVGMAANLVGIVLGIVGAVQKNRKKVFSILGLTINALVLLGLLGLMVIGLVA